MYLPNQFKSENKSFIIDLIHDYPFAILISNDENNFPFATHLPLYLKEEINQKHNLALFGHFAKANSHKNYLNKESLVIFNGPNSYLSPKVYENKQTVPTWNYLALHCKVNCEFIEEENKKDDLLKELIKNHEPEYAKQWQDLSQDFKSKMLNGIIAFKLNILDYQFKIKLNQHRLESHEKMFKIYKNGSESEQDLANWIIKLGMVKES